MRWIWSSTCEATMLLSSAGFDAAVVGRARRARRETGVDLRRPDALQHHFRGQARLGERHAVLRLHRRDVGVRCRVSNISVMIARAVEFGATR